MTWYADDCAVIEEVNLDYLCLHACVCLCLFKKVFENAYLTDV